MALEGGMRAFFCSGVKTFRRQKIFPVLERIVEDAHYVTPVTPVRSNLWLRPNSGAAVSLGHPFEGVAYEDGEGKTRLMPMK